MHIHTRLQAWSPRAVVTCSCACAASSVTWCDARVFCCTPLRTAESSVLACRECDGFWAVLVFSLQQSPMSACAAVMVLVLRVSVWWRCGCHPPLKLVAKQSSFACVYTTPCVLCFGHSRTLHPPMCAVLPSGEAGQQPLLLLLRGLLLCLLCLLFVSTERASLPGSHTLEAHVRCWPCLGVCCLWARSCACLFVAAAVSAMCFHPASPLHPPA
jgi:hypothetical protein